jgi:Reverse transcriptase (RNA-dependent DNA polymerase)
MADKARELYRILGRPSQAKFEQVISSNMITNCPITVDDARRAIIIYGPDIASVKGKTTHAVPAPHEPSFQSVPIPAPILEHHRDITLCVDFFFVQGHAFLHVISRKLQHRVAYPVDDRRQATMKKCIDMSLQQYHARGFRVTDIHADHEFDCLRLNLLPINLNIVAPDSHVGEVERSIRTIKERNRSTVHGLPYRRLPRLLVREIVKHSIQCLNQVPADDGLSTTMSPNTILTGVPNPDYNKLRLEFGTYVQVFEPTTFATNTLRSRTTGAIALTPTNNAQGDYFFLSLVTGKRLSRHQWTVIPMPDSAIARVEELAAAQDQPWIQTSGLLMEWRPNHIFDDDDDADFVYTPEVDDHDDDTLTYDFSIDSDDRTIHTNNLTDTDDHDFDANPDTIPNAIPGTIINVIPDTIPPPPALPDADDDVLLSDDDTFDHPAAVLDTPPPYNLRPGRSRTFSHRLDHQMDQVPAHSQTYLPLDNNLSLLQQSTIKTVTGFVLTQMSASAGIKFFGQPAIDAMHKEFCQLHTKGVFSPQDANTLTPQQKRASLRAVNLIKEKRTGEIKGRTCADGSVQRSLYDKSETTSPTVATDSLMYTILVDAKERRDVATADVVGAYLNADMDAYTLMKLTGETVDIMVKVDDMYKKYVTYENNKPVLYGCVKSALLWYDLFANTLKDLGFELNPYDPCVANKMIEGKQCTIVWYVDDNKISHVNPAVVTDIILKIEERFGKMTVTRGTEHTFLGMFFVFYPDGTVTISMKSYLEEAIAEADTKITKIAATPSKRDLFESDAKSPPLSKKESENFHSIVAKLLYVSFRVRADILLPISFLCTRVSKPTRQDQLKLHRVLEYLNGTLDLELKLGADDLETLHTWVDASRMRYTRT